MTFHTLHTTHATMLPPETISVKRLLKCFFFFIYIIILVEGRYLLSLGLLSRLSLLSSINGLGVWFRHPCIFTYHFPTHLHCDPSYHSEVATYCPTLPSFVFTVIAMVCVPPLTAGNFGAGSCVARASSPHADTSRKRCFAFRLFRFRAVFVNWDCECEAMEVFSKMTGV